jgi:PilZ domain-containing protein
MAKAEPDRRTARRVPVAVPMRVRHMRKQLLGAAQDMSRGGIFFFCESPVEADSDLELILQMPDEVGPNSGRWVSLFARVVRVEKSDPEGYGVAAKITHTETVDLT